MSEMSSGWIDLGRADTLGEGASLAVDVDGIPIVVVRCASELYAVEDRCTHDGEALGGAEVQDCQIICPRHGAHFCLRTGAALRSEERRVGKECSAGWRERDEEVNA